MGGPDLFDAIVETLQDKNRYPKGRFTEWETGILLKHMLKAVYCCHAHKISHNDLKPENFVFSSNAEDSPLKMIDLGLAEKHEKKQQLESNSSAPSSFRGT